MKKKAPHENSLLKYKKSIGIHVYVGKKVTPAEDFFQKSEKGIRIF